VTVHSGAIANLSAPLDRAINGHFKEAQENRVRFPDIEVQDFEKICAVAYGAHLPLPEVRTLPASETNIKEDCWVLSARIIGPDSVTMRSSAWKQDVTDALLGYARIYMFADEQLIAKLQLDAEAGLRNFLGYIDIYSPTRSAVLELVRYVYNSEMVHDRDDGEVMHPLREIVVHFMALHFSVFRDYAPHRELMRREGNYALDLQDVIAEWLL
jgi:hypothetical protein